MLSACEYEALKDMRVKSVSTGAETPFVKATLVLKLPSLRQQVRGSRCVCVCLRVLCAGRCACACACACACVCCVSELCGVFVRACVRACACDVREESERVRERQNGESERLSERQRKERVRARVRERRDRERRD